MWTAEENIVKNSDEKWTQNGSVIVFNKEWERGGTTMVFVSFLFITIQVSETTLDNSIDEMVICSRNMAPLIRKIDTQQFRNIIAYTMNINILISWVKYLMFCS